MRDETIHCHPGTGAHVGATLFALIFWPAAICPWFGPHPVPVLSFVGLSLLCGLPPLLFIVWNLRSRRSADAAGLSWRTGFGRSRAVPWTSVVALHDRRFAGEPGHAAELSDGRLVGWCARWPNGAALKQHVANRLDRGAYRCGGDRFDDAPARFTFRAWPRRLEAAFGLAFAASVLVVVAWIAAALVAMIRRGGDVGPPLYMLSLVVVPVVFAALDLVRVVWRQRRAHSRDVLVLDPRGLTVTGGAVELRASWSDVVSVARLPSLSASALRVVTTAGTFDVPFDQTGLVRAQLRARLPPAVRDACERPDGDARPDRSTTLSDGSRRHGFDSFGLRAPWLLEALAMTLIWFLTLTEVSTAHLATLAALCALVLLLHRGARAFLGVTVSPTGCAWSGPRRRRRFAWSEVAAVTFPAHPDLCLALRLTDGTRLWCFPSLLAGGGALVASFREHLAATPRLEGP
jgi:hypothetical protein